MDEIRGPKEVSGSVIGQDTRLSPRLAHQSA